MPSIKIDKLPYGKDTNIVSYSVSEGATTIDPSTFDGALGQMSFDVDDFRDSHELLGEVVTLTDGARGKYQAVVRDISGSDGALSVTADSILALFNSFHAVPTVYTTIGAYVTSLRDLVGITNTVRVDLLNPGNLYVFPGFVGNVWDNLKQVLAAHQIEMSLVFNQVVIRPLRTVTAVTERATTESYTLNNAVTAEQVEIYYYNHVWGYQKEVYPLASGADTQIFTVDSGATVVQNVAIEGSALAVNQPTVQNYVNNTSYAGTNGVYAVSGNDGLPVTAAQWIAEGGTLSVRITDDPSILEVTVKGAVNTTLAPFRIAMTAGTGSFYNALHITATGSVWDKKLLTLTTGATPNATGEIVGTTVDNRYISTLAQAYTAGLRTAGTYAGPSYTWSGSVESMNDRSQSGQFIASTFGDFNVPNTGKTFNDYNTLWPAQTFTQFDAFWNDQAALNFDNQLFGQGIGARWTRDDVVFRVDSTTTDASSVQFSASLDTTFGDFTLSLDGKTFGDFNTIHAGRSFADFAPIPLRNA